MAEYLVERGDTIPIQIVIDKKGGQIGFFPVVALRDGTAITTPLYMDWADTTFKASGFTTRLQTLTEISTSQSPGRYAFPAGLDLSAVTGLPLNASKVIAEFEARNASGGVVGVTDDVFILGDTWYQPASFTQVGSLESEVSSILTSVESLHTRVSSVPAGVDVVLTAAHGAGSWNTATGFAVPGDNMGLTPTAISSAAVAVNSLLSGIHGVGAWDGITDITSVFGFIVDDTGGIDVDFLQATQEMHAMLTATIIRSLSDYSFLDRGGVATRLRLRDDDPLGRTRLVPSSLGIPSSWGGA